MRFLSPLAESEFNLHAAQLTHESLGVRGFCVLVAAANRLIEIRLPQRSLAFENVTDLKADSPTAS